MLYDRDRPAAMFYDGDRPGVARCLVLYDRLAGGDVYGSEGPARHPAADVV